MERCLYKELDFSADGFGLFELFAEEPRAFFLDSSLQDARQGRYSLIGFDPFDVFMGGGKEVLANLKKKFSVFTSYAQEEFTPLSCGMVGYLGYEYGLHQENIELKGKEDLGLPEVMFGFYDCILTIDHWKKKLYVTSSGLPEKDKSLREKRAKTRLEYILKKIEEAKFSLVERGSELGSPRRAQTKGFLDHSARLGGSKSEPLSFDKGECFELLSNFSQEQYFDAVNKALEYIARGDIYQVNLAQRFRVDCREEVTAKEIYQVLRELSPASFASYLNAGDFQIISSSPERFLRLQNNVVQTRPMKGTRPRGKDEQEDHALRKEIEQSPKDKAELLMITDLLRNDLGRVCQYGSVRVKEMRAIEEYRTVFQATSTVEGDLRQGKDCFDVLRACFPGGSITGCPKIRAMEIIEELEPVRRGVYTGSLGYINSSGDMDFNILIRTILARQGELYFHVGGGIVADSTPEGEYEETLVKASAIQECLEKCLGLGHRINL